MPIKLDKIDKRLLLELDRNSRIPETRLAKIVGRSKESIRYRLKKLQEESLIQGFTIWIDPTRLGYQSAKIYLTLANRPEEKQKFIEYVKKDKRLFWLGIAEGAWNAGLTFFVKSNREFFDLKNELFSKFKDLILESRTAVLVNVNTKEKSFLVPAEHPRWQTIFGQEEEFILEPLEKSILKELFLNARINIVEIARKHNSSVDIVRNRMKRLEERKIVVKYTVNINLAALEYEFYKTFLYFRNLSRPDEQKLMEYARKNKSIIHLVKQISPWDIELESYCENYKEYNTIINNLTKEFSNIIQKVETAIMGEDYIFPAEKMIFEE